MVRNPGVHQLHCCKKHGCKYGSPECPVFTGFDDGNNPKGYRCPDCDEPGFAEAINDD